jgi:hypothetical protein
MQLDTYPQVQIRKQEEEKRRKRKKMVSRVKETRLHVPCLGTEDESEYLMGRGEEMTGAYL